MTESTHDQRGALLRACSPIFTGVIDRAGRNAKTMRLTLERIRTAAERAAI